MTLIIIIIMAFFIAFCFFFAMSEAAIVAVNPSHLKKMITMGDRRASVALKLISSRKVFFGTVLIGTNVAFIAFSTIGESVLHSESTLEFIRNILILDCIVLVLGEIIPKSLALDAPDRFALMTAPAITFISRLMIPFVKVANLIPSLFLKTASDDEASANLVTDLQIKIAFTQGSREGTVEEEEKDLGLKIIDFAETTVDRVMTLRGDIFALPANLTTLEASAKIHDLGFSRIPVYEDDNEDDIIGFISVKDIISAFIEGRPDLSLKELKRDITFIPDKKKVLDLMLDFQREHSHIAMVVDEAGSITGLVTLEDLIEEVVGEIYDEHDEPEEIIHKLGTDTYLLDGRLEIDEVNKALPIKLEEGVYETLGGYVMGLFGKVPHEGNSIQHQNVHFTIMKMDERRIDKVKIKLERFTSSDKTPD